jgi:DNA-binding NtrC family response regulator
VVEVSLAALRDRREDIPYLTAAFVRDCAARMHKPLTASTPAAERLLLSARWDGQRARAQEHVSSARAC